MRDNGPIQLDSLEKIANSFRVSPKRVKKWCAMKPPPPIAVEGEKSKRRYSAEYYALLDWRTRTFSPSHKTTPEDNPGVEGSVS